MHDITGVAAADANHERVQSDEWRRPMTSTVHSVGANDLHSQVTAHSHKYVFGTSFSSVSESEVPEPELLEHRPVHVAVEADWEYGP